MLVFRIVWEALVGNSPVLRDRRFVVRWEVSGAGRSTALEGKALYTPSPSPRRRRRHVATPSPRRRRHAVAAWASKPVGYLPGAPSRHATAAVSRCSRPYPGALPSRLKPIQLRPRNVTQKQWAGTGTFPPPLALTAEMLVGNWMLIRVLRHRRVRRFVVWWRSGVSGAGRSTALGAKALSRAMPCRPPPQPTAAPADQALVPMMQKV